MERSEFEARCASYRRVRGRNFVDASRCSVCPVLAQRGSGSSLPSALNFEGTPSGGVCASTASCAPLSEPPPESAIVSEFWGGLNQLLATLIPDDKSRQRRVVTAFEEMHYSLLRDSSLEDIDAVAGLIQASVERCGKM